jgi:hypothetical protein
MRALDRRKEHLERHDRHHPDRAQDPVVLIFDAVNPSDPYRSIVARYCWEAVALFRGGTDPSLR